MSPSPPRPKRRWLIAVGKVAAGLVVAAAVAGNARDAAEQLASQPRRPGWGWLAVALVLYVVGLLPMAWFWRRTLAALGQPSGWRRVLPGYYLGHLGKYVPGKAMVVVLRTGAIRHAGGAAAPIAASVFVETLTMMAVGGVLASALLAGGAAAGAPGWLTMLAATLAAVAAVPTLPPVMRRLLARFTPPGDRPAGEQPGGGVAAGVSWRLLGAGWAAGLVAWGAIGASLWACARAVAPAAPISPAGLLGATLAACLPVVAGFLSLLPGGLLVRDGLMFSLLATLPGVDPPAALAATLLARLVWIAGEGAACGILALCVRRPAAQPPTAQPPTAQPPTADPPG